MKDKNIINEIESLKNIKLNEVKTIENICIIIKDNEDKSELKSIFLKENINNTNLDYSLRRSILGSTSSNRINQIKFMLLFKILIKVFKNEIDIIKIINFIKEKSNPKFAINKTEIKYYLYFQINALNYILLEFGDENIKDLFIKTVLRYDYLIYLLSGIINSNIKNIQNSKNYDSILNIYMEIFTKINFKENINYNRNSFVISLFTLISKDNEYYQQIKKQMEITISPKTLSKSLNNLILEDISKNDDIKFLEMIFKLYWNNFIVYGEKMFNFIDYQLSDFNNDQKNRKNKSILIILILKYYIGKFTKFNLFDNILKEVKYNKITKRIINFYLYQKKINNKDTKLFIKYFELNLSNVIKGDSDICYNIYNLLNNTSKENNFNLNKGKFIQYLISIFIKNDNYLEKYLNEIIFNLEFNLKNNIFLKNNIYFKDLEIVFNEIDINNIQINNEKIYKNLINKIIFIFKKYNVDTLKEDLEDYSNDKLTLMIKETFYNCLFHILSKVNNDNIFDFGLNIVQEVFINDEKEKKEFFDNSKKFIKLLNNKNNYENIKKLLKIFLIEKSVVLEDSDILDSINDICEFIKKHLNKKVNEDDREIFFDALIHLTSNCDKNQREIINSVIKSFVNDLNQNCFDILFDEITKEKEELNKNDYSEDEDLELS